MAVDNKLKVQGRTERSTEEDKDISYKGDKINTSEDTNAIYVINDIVSKQQGQKFEKFKNEWITYPKEDFEGEVLNKKFKSESVYYKSMNNIFNTAKLPSYNIISMLQPFSPQSETRTINKNSSSNDIKEVLKTSLENFIAYYFYDMILSQVNISLENNNVEAECKYMRMTFSYINKSTKNSQVASNNSLYFRINDDDLRLKKLDPNSIKNTSQLCHKANLPIFDHATYTNNSGWGNTITYHNYNYDAKGHIISRSDSKSFKLPKKYIMRSVNYFSGDYTKGMKVVLSDGIFECDYLEVVLKDPVDGYTRSIYIDGEEIYRISSNTFNFSGVKIVSEYVSSGGSGYGGGGGFSVNLYAMVDDSVQIRENTWVPRVGSNASWLKTITYSSIIKVTGYYISSQ